MSFHLEGSAKILMMGGVFLNPAQVFNRDLSILVASAFAADTKLQSLSILEPLAATGLRSIRYYKEIGVPVGRIVANDIDSDAVKQINNNFEQNEVPGEVWQKDALDAMYSSRGCWDLVDVDPYGSTASFLDAAVQAVKPGGLLCVTSTDMITLCGNNPDTCFYKYQSIPSKARYCHEFAVRILLYQLNATANKYQLAVRPLISLSVDFYVRVFVQVISSAATAKLSLANSSLVLQCSACPAFYVQKLGRAAKKRHVGNNFEAPAVCGQCESSLKIQGPIYTGLLHDKNFVSKVIEHCDAKEFKTKDKVRGVLNCIKEEIEEPLGWSLGSLCKFFKIPAMPQKNLRSALRGLNREVSQSHTNPLIYKTTATPAEMFEILKYWKKLKAPENYLKGIPEGSAAYKILRKEPEIPQPDFDQELSEHERMILKQIRYPANEKNWGPKARPKKEKSDE